MILMVVAMALMMHPAPSSPSSQPRSPSVSQRHPSPQLHPAQMPQRPRQPFIAESSFGSMMRSVHVRASGFRQRRVLFSMAFSSLTNCGFCLPEGPQHPLLNVSRGGAPLQIRISLAYGGPRPSAHLGVILTSLQLLKIYRNHPQGRPGRCH